jgi:hypothetical protein
MGTLALFLISLTTNITYIRECPSVGSLVFAATPGAATGIVVADGAAPGASRACLDVADLTGSERCSVEQEESVVPRFACVESRTQHHLPRDGEVLPGTFLTIFTSPEEPHLIALLR